MCMKKPFKKKSFLRFSQNFVYERRIFRIYVESVLE